MDILQVRKQSGNVLYGQQNLKRAGNSGNRMGEFFNFWIR